jgi:hypothetical protein
MAAVFHKLCPYSVVGLVLGSLAGARFKFNVAYSRPCAVGRLHVQGAQQKPPSSKVAANPGQLVISRCPTTMLPRTTKHPTPFMDVTTINPSAVAHGFSGYLITCGRPEAEEDSTTLAR